MIFWKSLSNQRSPQGLDLFSRKSKSKKGVFTRSKAFRKPCKRFLNRFLEEDDASAGVYNSTDQESECSSSDVVVDQEVAGGMSPESADLIAELETPIQPKGDGC